MPTAAEVSQALLLALLDRAAAGGADTAADLATLAEADVDDLAARLGEGDKGPARTVRKDAPTFPQETGPVAAGLAVVADDTGRVLLLQRQNDPDDPNRGKWEMPGGKCEGMAPLETAVKEWVEEVGLPLPPGRLGAGRWVSADGRYAGFVYRTPAEADVPIHRERRGDADPDSGGWAAVAWVDPQDLPWHNLRPALLADMGRLMPSILADASAYDVLVQMTKYLVAGVVRKGWRRIGPPHESQTVDGVELRLVNLGGHMGTGKWRLGVVGADGTVTWRHDGATRAAVEERVPEVVAAERLQRRKERTRKG